MPPSPDRSLRRAFAVLWRLIRGTLVSVLVLLTFVLALVFAVLIHLDLPAVRRTAQTELNEILAPEFKGTIRVERIGRLSIFGVGGVDATVTAEDGSKVIVARGVTARIAPLALAKSALFGKGDLRIEVKSIDVLAIEANLDGGPDGSPKLVHAFDPRTPSPPSTPGSRGTDIALPSVIARHIWVHGAMSGAPPIDADVDALAAAFLSTPNLTKLGVAHLGFVARNLPEVSRAHGDVIAQLVIPSAQGAPMQVHGDLRGRVGVIPLTANVAVVGDRVDAVLDVPTVSAEDVQESVVGAPLYAPVSLHAEAHGLLAALHATLDAKLGKGSVEADATVAAKGKLGGHAKLEARHVDARTFSRTAPATDVGLELVAEANTRADDSLHGRALLVVPSGRAAGQPIPYTSLNVEAVQWPGGERTPSRLTAYLQGVTLEPGAPVGFTARATHQGESTSATFGVKVSAPDLAAVKRVPALGKGAVDVTVSGRAAIARQVSFEADAVAKVDHFENGGARVKHADVDARVQGTPAAPVVDARLLATGLSGFGYELSRLEAEVAGGLEKAKVALSAHGPKVPDVQLGADVSLADGIRVDGLNLDLTQGRTALNAFVGSFGMKGSTIDASGILVRGAGEPLTASFEKTPDVLALKAESKGIDLGILGSLVHKDTLKGKLSLDVDATVHRDSAKGKVKVDLEHGTFGKIGGADAHVALALDGRRVQGALRAALGDVGSFRIDDLDVHVGGEGPLSARSWKQAWGKADLVGNVDAARAVNLLPEGSFPLADVAGHLVLEGHVERDSADDLTPDVRVSLWTRGLSAVGQSVVPVRLEGGPLMVGPPSWTLRGVDFGVDVIVDGDEGAGELAFRAFDPKGALLGVDLKTASLPWGEVLHATGQLRQRLLELPVSLRAVIPRRDVTDLPLLIRPGGIKGAFDGNITLDGTALAPNLDVVIASHALCFRSAPDVSVDGTISAKYDGSAGQLLVDLHSPKERLLGARVDVTGKIKDALRGGPIPWTGSATATLGRFPLESIPMLADDQVKGFLSGQVSLTGLHEHAKADVHVEVDDLWLGKAKFTKGAVDATLDDDGLKAKARLEDPRGFLEADATMGMTWGAAVAPSPNDKGLQAQLQAKHFSAAAAAPFVGDAISKLAGWIDADAKVSLVPGKKPEMSGTVTLSQGVVQTPALGEEFHDVKAKVTLAPDGSVKLEDTEAHGLSGRLTATGGAHLDGMNLKDAHVELDIKKKEGIPVDVQGSNLGTVYGTVKAKVEADQAGKSLAVNVDVPSLHFDLPAGSLPRSPEALDPAPHVHIGVYRTNDRFLVLPTGNAPPKLVAKRNVANTPIPEGSPAAAQLQQPNKPATALVVKVHIEDLQVVRGQQIKAALGGDLTTEVGAATVVRGQIKIKSGTLDVQSKEFNIDKGTISFVGDDPSNPEVDVTASWEAPDGTKVFADYIGPAKTGKVTLRSEPARPKNEIVQLILFGTADGSESTPYASPSPSTGTEVGTTVGGLATDGISKGLDQLTGMNVTTKIDTSQPANPRPEVEIQIAKDISLEIAVVLGTPPPGTNPDTTYATVDWRFAGNWTLGTTVGDAGSTFADMVWHYRY